MNLYWSMLILALGACVGSFLNVIIYRWPRDLSIRRPVWSFCPTCRATILFRDNVPIISYLLLGGRCRHCRQAISLQYPLVELATALAFLITYDAFFVAKLRAGITDLGADWPILLAHWALCAGLIALAVMDLEAYMVDIRVTWLVTLAGLVGHMLWTPASSTWDGAWIRPGVLQAVTVCAAVIGLVIGAVIFLRGQPESSESPEPQPEPVPPSAEPAPPSAPLTPAPAEAGDASSAVAIGEVVPSGDPAQIQPVDRRWIWALLPVLLVLAYVAVMAWQEHRALEALPSPPQRLEGRMVFEAPPLVEAGVVRIGVGLIVLFIGLTLVASLPQPEADAEIVEAIDAEAIDARRNSLWELGLLGPAILLMIVAWLVMARWPAAREACHALLHWQPMDRGRLMGHWQPLWGLATGLAGWAIGGAIGWGMRIVFTLGLGKEALGMGDVHILAATGAVAGWCVALLGFFVAAPLALLAIVAIHLRRQSRALPYGPWLGLAFFVVIIFQDRMLRYLNVFDLIRFGTVEQ